MKLKTLIAIAFIAGSSITTAVQAENPLDVRRLITTRQCSRCDLYRANLNFTNLRQADLRDAEMYGVGLRLSDLTEANLSGANLYRADLGGADLTGANLAGADLNEANLCGATMPDGKKSQQGCPK